MTKFGIAFWAALPMLLTSAALAQTAPAAAPAPAHHQWHGDMTAMHKQMCLEGYAHTSARLGYLQGMLGLTDQQQAVWNRYRQAVLDQAGKRRTACSEMAPEARAKLTVLDHEAHQEKMLEAELQGLQATRPALEALYNGLTAEQKATFDRVAMHQHHGHEAGAFGMHHGVGMGMGAEHHGGMMAPEATPPANAGSAPAEK
jgi:hypothetical protein